MSAPALECVGVCDEFVRGKLAAMGVEAHVTHVPPLVRTDWEPLNMRCPHGVLWFTEPTSEQMAAWTEDGAA